MNDLNRRDIFKNMFAGLAGIATMRAIPTESCLPIKKDEPEQRNVGPKEISVIISVDHEHFQKEMERCKDEIHAIMGVPQNDHPLRRSNGKE